ncbi:HTTM domain-containing protein [soil metagenome]
MIRIEGSQVTDESVPEKRELISAIAGRWMEYLQEPVDGASLAVFRMCFAAFMLAMVWEYWHLQWITILSSKTFYHFSYFPGMPTWPGDGMVIHFCLLALLAVQIGFGVCYRPACLLFFLAYTYVFLLEKTFYQNHLYLVCLLSFLLFLVPANRVWSLDNLEAKLPPFVPRWSMIILKTQFVLVYFFGGIAKLNPDWLHGEPQSTWLRQIASTDTVFGPVIGHPLFALLITYGGIAVDFSVGFLLAYRPTFWLGAAIALAFHLTNARLFDIGIFPWMMIATIGLFAPEDWPRRLLRLVLPKPKTEISSAPAMPSSQTLSTQTWRRRLNICTIVFLHFYILVQVLVPFRRFIYPGVTSWTEQGHRFAWGMKLRDKQVPVFEMFAFNPKTGNKKKVHTELLAPYQLLKMKSHPDMILQFAHSVADSMERKFGVRPIVTAKCVAMLNQHPAQDLIDPNVDLAAQPINLMPAPWIVPLSDQSNFSVINIRQEENHP